MALSPWMLRVPETANASILGEPLDPVRGRLFPVQVNPRTGCDQAP